MGTAALRNRGCNPTHAPYGSDTCVSLSARQRLTPWSHVPCCHATLVPRALARPPCFRLALSPRRAASLRQIWIGQGASQSEKVSAFPYAQKYLKDHKRPPVLPITRYAEGKEASSFTQLFGPPAAKGGACCVIS